MKFVFTIMMRFVTSFEGSGIEKEITGRCS